MSKKDLIIVESPSKVKKVSQYAGSKYIVLASVGHFMNLVRVSYKTYDPVYEPDEGKKKVIDELKKAAAKVDKILIATDPDREGEAIAWHIHNLLNSINPNIKRISFNEITKHAVQTALSAPRNLDQDLIDAAKARQILDLMVGFKVSKLVKRSITAAKSAGRVQSPALRLVIERQEEIDKFIPVKYWTIEAKFKTPSGEIFDAALDVKKRLEDFAEVQKILSDLKKEKFIISDIEEKVVKRNPYPPFDTSTLQQTASSILGWAPKKTSSISQKLYQDGFITYIRTDSFTISDDAMQMARNYIQSKFASSYLPKTPNHYKKKSKAVKEQGAHECIRPTDVNSPPLLSGDNHQLYELIFNRFVSSQMEPALFDQVTYTIGAGNYNFKATGQIQKFDGYLKLWGKYSQTSEKILPKVLKNDILNIDDLKDIEHTTKPPPQYTQATLIKKLEEEGIGRPSTYPTIIDVISSEDRNYTSLKKQIFVPTQTGKDLIEFLKSKFGNNFIEYKYTALLEEKLDKIANGNLNWKDVIKSFATDLMAIVDGIRKEINDESTTDIPCPKCTDGHLMKRRGKYGIFYSCSNWINKKNKCTYIATLDLDGNLVAKPDPKKSKFKCPLCKGILIERNIKGNSVLGCENYPKCTSGIFDLEGNIIYYQKDHSPRKKKKRKN